MKSQDKKNEFSIPSYLVFLSENALWMWANDKREGWPDEFIQRLPINCHHTRTSQWIKRACVRLICKGDGAILCIESWQVLSLAGGLILTARLDQAFQPGEKYRVNRVDRGISTPREWIRRWKMASLFRPSSQLMPTHYFYSFGAFHLRAPCPLVHIVLYCERAKSAEWCILSPKKWDNSWEER